jgi:nitroreductase
MKCIEQLLSRRSIRKYKKIPVPEEIINNILEAGRLAPTAVNSQPWHFIILKEQESKEACSFGNYNRWAADADFIIVGVYKPSEVMIEHLTIMDVTIALQNMAIAGLLQGVGSCWIGAWDDTKLRRVLALPVDSKIVGIIPFGYPDGTPAKPSKKPLKQILHFDKW